MIFGADPTLTEHAQSSQVASSFEGQSTGRGKIGGDDMPNWLVGVATRTSLSFLLFSVMAFGATFGASMEAKLINAIDAGKDATITKILAKNPHLDLSKVFAHSVETENMNAASILIDSRDFDLELGLNAAAENGNTQLIRLILDHGASPSHRAVCLAIQGQHLEATKMLLDQWGKPTEAMVEFAVTGGASEILECVLEAGGDIHSQATASPRVLGHVEGGFWVDYGKDPRGDTPLAAVIRQGNADLVKTLLGFGVDPNRSFIRKDTPESLFRIDMESHLRPYDHRVDYGGGKVYVQKGYRKSFYGFGDPDLELREFCENQFTTPLILAVREEGLSEDARKSIVMLLVEHGANVEAVDKSGRTARSYAESLGRLNIIDLLTAEPEQK